MAATALAPGTEYVLTVSCADRPGLIQAIAGFLVDHDANVIESKQFDDRQARKFFMRVQFESAAGSPLDGDVLRKDFTAVAESFGMTWNLTDTARRQRALIMVSKYGHCLNDLLFRASTGWLNIDVVAVVSNHPDLAPMADDYEIPFYHVPVDPADKAKAERELLRLADETRADLVVLARYMQILSDDLCRALEGRRSTSTTPCCPASRAPAPTTRPTNAA